VRVVPQFHVSKLDGGAQVGGPSSPWALESTRTSAICSHSDFAFEIWIRTNHQIIVAELAYLSTSGNTVPTRVVAFTLCPRVACERAEPEHIRDAIHCIWNFIVARTHTASTVLGGGLGG